MASVQLKLLGGFAASLSSGRPVQLVGKKNRALLAYLAVNRGKRHSRGRLMGLLWSDRGEAQARGSLRQALAALKEALAGVEPVPLILDGDGVTLDPAAVSADVASFEQLAGSESVGDLRQAAKLYEGDLLDEMAVPDPGFGDWLSAERARLREAAVGAMTRLTAQLTGTEAIAMGKRLIALDPLREASHRALMEAYAAQGERDQAIRQYQACREILRRELQVEPSDETTGLHEDIGEGRYKPSASEKAAEAVAQTSLAAPNNHSVAVLPFDNRSDDPQQGYFADGITEDIITELSRFQSLFVIARNSSFQFRSKAVDVKHVGRELGVQYVVEGSIRRIGDRLRLTAQLVDSLTGNHVWAERYDRNVQDIFTVQDDVTRMIAATIAGRVEAVGAKIARRKPTSSLAAYDCVLSARAIRRAAYFDTNLFLKGAVKSARELLERAIRIDPDYAGAYAELAWTYMDEWFNLGNEKDLEQAFRYAQTAARLDPADSTCQRALGMGHLWLRRYGEAAFQLERAVSINPNDVMAAQNLAVYLDFIGRFSEAKALVQQAMRLDPYHFGSLRETLGYSLYALGQYEEAIVELRKIDPLPIWFYPYLAACYAQLDRMDEARAAAAAFLDTMLPTSAESPATSITIDRETRLRAITAYIGTYKYQADRDRWFNAMRKAGIPV